MLFKNGGNVFSKEKLLYDRKPIDIVSALSYAGLSFTCTLSLFKIEEAMVVKDKETF